MKKCLLLLSLLLTGVNSWAYDAEIDGIYYNLNGKNKTAEVTHPDFKYQYIWDFPVSFHNVNVTSTWTFDFVNGLCTRCVIKYTFPSESSAMTVYDEIDNEEKDNYSLQGNVILYDKTKDYIDKSSENVVRVMMTSYGRYATVVKGEENYSGNVIIPETVTYNDNSYAVVSIGDEAFKGCEGIISITIPSGVTSIGSAVFSSCSGLTSITLPEGLTSIESSAFRSCTGLSSVSIPASVKKIGSDAFYGCTGLTKAEFASIESLCAIKCDHEYFDGTNPLSYAHHLYIAGKEITEVVIPEGVDSIGDYAFKGGSYITSVTMPGSVVSIGRESFYGCMSLTSISIPEGVSSIGYGAFWGCSALVSILFPSSVTKVDQFAFADCNSLNRVEFASLEGLCGIDFYDNPLSLTHHLYINGAEIKDLVIPDGVPSIGRYAFEGCNALTSIYIPESVTSIGPGAFSGCNSVSLVISKAKNPTLGFNVFYEIASNAILSIPPFSEDAYKDCFGSFSDWTSDIKVDGLYYNLDDDDDGTAWVEKPVLEPKPYSGDIVIPSAITYDGVEYPVVGIDNYAFKDATITSVVIPNGVRFIDGAAFYNCENLTSIVIPKTVRSIGASAFMYCDDVEELICLVKNPFAITGKGVEGTTFSNYFFKNVPLYVPKGTAEVYRETEGWKDFANIVEGVPENYDATLTVKQANNGTVGIQVTKGNAYTLDIKAEDGWQIHSVTFNEQDVTRQLSNGKFTTPTITGDATLNVVYEQEGGDAVGSLQASSVKILATAFGVSVTGTQAGESIFVYSEDGMLLQSVRVSGNQTNISLPLDALYVIKVGSQVMKLRR